MGRGNWRGICCYSLALTVALTVAQVRADAYVAVSYDGFSPSEVTIAPGEAVFWIVADDMGPYTISSPKGLWSPYYLYDEGDSTGLQFNQAGDYSYYDALNNNSGVVHVRVSVPNQPPTIATSTPTDGAVFTAPASFTFSVDASDLDDGLSHVEFYVGSELVDDVYSAPFSTTVTNRAAGVYTLVAVAYDFTGASTTNTVSITVLDGVAPTPKLEAPSVAGGHFRFDVNGVTAGKQVVLQSSSALADTNSWASVQTNVPSGSSVTFTIPVASGNCFFRVVQLL